MQTVFAFTVPFNAPITGVNPCVPGWGPNGEVGVVDLMN